MRPTGPLLVLTIGQGLAVGLMTAEALLNWAGMGTVAVLGAALVAAAVGGAGSFFHMHRLAAAKYVLRRLASSWLSREALSTAVFGAALAGLLGWRLAVRHPGWRFAAVSMGVALIGWLAVWITAQLYASIRAMLSWYSPWTVVTMMTSAITGGGIAAWAIAPRAPLLVRLVLTGLLILSLGFKLLQWRYFNRKQHEIGSQATAFPFGPVRLYDTGTAKPPYRTQPQTWPGIGSALRRRLQAGVVLAECALPGILLWAAGLSRAAAVAAAFVWLIGIGLDRWLFFADAIHSSRIFFPIDGARTGG